MLILLALLLAQTVQPVQGTGKAGNPATGVVTVQGPVVPGSPVIVSCPDGTCSGGGGGATTVTANQGTAGATDWKVADSLAKAVLDAIKADADKIPSSPATDRTTAASPFSASISFSGTFIDPRAIRALTASDVVSAVQSGSWNVGQSGTWNITNLSGTVSLPTNAAAETGGHLASLDGKDFATQTTLAAIKAKTDNLDVLLSTRTKPADTQAISAASLPLPSGAATSASQTDGTQKAIVRGGAKGASTAADVTSTAEGADHQAADMQLYSGGAAIDPRQATLQAGSTTTVTQATGTNLHAVLDSTSTTAVTQATGTNLHAVLDTTSTTAVTQATGTNLHAVIDSGSTTAATQSTGTNLHVVTDATSVTSADVTDRAGRALGVVASITNPVSSAESGTWTVQPGNTQNTTPWSTAVLDQSVAATTLSAACTSATACGATASIQIAATGMQAAEITVTAVSSPVGIATACDTSYDGGTTYLLAKCIFQKSDAASTGTTKAALANGDLAASTSWELLWPGAPDHIRVRLSLLTSGTVTIALRGTSSNNPQLPVGAAIANGAPINGAGSNIGVPLLTVDSSTPTTGRMARSDPNGLLVSQPTAANLNATVTGTVTTSPPANASTNLAQVAGTTTDTNSGSKSAGTIRVVLATDQPALTNKLLVTPDSVALPANQSVNAAQFGGTNVSTGTGAGGAGIPRVTVSNDSTVGLVAGAAIVGKVGIDQTTMGTTNGVVHMPTTVAGAALSQKPFTANTALNVKASAGNVYGWAAINAAASVCWLQFYNTAGTPTCGTSVIWSVPLPVTPGVSNFVPANIPLQNHATGIAICVSTTATGGTTCGSTASGTVFFQ